MNNLDETDKLFLFRNSFIPEGDNFDKMVINHEYSSPMTIKQPDNRKFKLDKTKFKSIEDLVEFFEIWFGDIWLDLNYLPKKYR